MAKDLLADDSEGIDLLADDDGIDLLANLPKAKPKASAKKSWLQELGDQAEAATNFIPVAAGGALQGFATPFQGIASMLPGKMAEDFAKEDFTRFLPGPKDDTEKGLQGASEFLGALGPLGKLFGSLKSGAAAARIPKNLQNATALAGTGAIATPGDEFDKTLGAAGGLALGGAGKLASKASEKVPEFLRGLTNESNPEALAGAIQKPHDILSNTANQLYGYVKDSIKKRNLSIPVKPEYIDQARAILPNTRASEKLISKAKSGDYEAVHDLQSHLYKKGTKGIASDDIALENQGEEILELRHKINDDLNDHLMQSGNVDIAHILQQGRNTHKKLMDTYFNKNLPKGIHKLVQSELRLIPKKPENLFSQNSKPMSEFLRKHPEAEKHIQGIKEKEAAKKALANIFGTTAKVGGVGYVGKTLFDLLQ